MCAVCKGVGDVLLRHVAGSSQGSLCGRSAQRRGKSLQLRAVSGFDPSRCTEPFPRQQVQPPVRLGPGH